MSLPHFLQTRIRSPPSRRRLTRVGSEQFGQMSITLDTCIVPSFCMIPPWGFFWLGRVARLTMFACSTVTRCFSGKARRTLPSLPLSLPAMMRTLSPRRTCIELAMSDAPPLQHFRRERHDLHVALVAQLARDRAEDAR